MLLKRTASAMPVAMVGTLGLFYVMQGLVAQDTGDIFEVPDRRPVVIFDQSPPVEPKAKEWVVDEPPFVDPPPKQDPPTNTRGTEDGTTLPPIVPPKPPRVDPGPTFKGLADGAAVPLVRVAPQYPTSAASRGTEGWVIIRFNVDEYGSVVEPEIIDAQPKGVFDRAAMKAIQKFKYKPKVVDGIARPFSGVQYRFTFELAGDAS